jgi:hypothetical protein
MTAAAGHKCIQHGDDIVNLFFIRGCHKSTSFLDLNVV